MLNPLDRPPIHQHLNLPMLFGVIPLWKTTKANEISMVIVASQRFTSLRKDDSIGGSAFGPGDTRMGPGQTSPGERRGTKRMITLRQIQSARCRDEHRRGCRGAIAVYCGNDRSRMPRSAAERSWQ